MEIRPADENDATLICALGIKTFVETFADYNTTENMDMYIKSTFTVEKIAAELADERNMFYVAGEDGHLIGYAKLRQSEAPETLENISSIELERLYVDRNYLGRNVGRSLMQKCMEVARSLGFKIIWLGVWEHNERALRFYKKFGFERFSEHIFPVGNDPQIDHLMKKTL